MINIDEKFKDNDPVSTVEKIQGILKSLGIETREYWNDSGLDNCWSLSLKAHNGTPSTNGKGVTRELARASAYAEFIERIQGGIFLYKIQSAHRHKPMDLHHYAPDGKYMTTQELIENGQWMDHIIEACNDPMITRQSIAEHCRAYACTDEDKILTLPFYSLFEGKHVYLPIGFVDHIYASNGCCAGNSREEAWVHAMSEMMERHATIKILTSGCSAPKIPEEVLSRFSTVSNIIKQIRQSGNFDIDVFDYSIGNNFPVVATRIINKKNQSYRINIGADPVLEIALQRTLTELFQGKNIHNFASNHSGKIMNKVSDFPEYSNVLNQLETSNGLYTADFFANELTCQKQPAQFPDNSDKTNKELLSYMLDLYRQLNKPVYVRNFSYLGFPSYRFVVPGFSEALAVTLKEIIPEYALADSVCGTLRNAAAASNEDLSWMLNYSAMITGHIGRYNYFGRLSGIPLSGYPNYMLGALTRAYASYRLGKYSDAIGYLNAAIPAANTDEDRTYFECINKYLSMKVSGISEEKIRTILYKFFNARYADRLYEKLDSGKTPYDDYLMRCSFADCQNCQYRSYCSYEGVAAMIDRVGQRCKAFINGQDPSEFAV